MRRRQFIGLMGTAALSFSRPGYAQNNTSLPLVGVLVMPKQDTEFARQIFAALRNGLQQEGFAEGKNYSLAIRSGNGDSARLPSLAKELDGLRPRVIVAASTAALVAPIASLRRLQHCVAPQKADMNLGAMPRAPSV